MNRIQKTHFFMLKYFLVLVLSSIFFWGCSSSKKDLRPDEDKTRTSLPKEIQNKKIALINIEAEPTQKKITEVALINQLLKNGSFFLIPKQEVEAQKRAATAESPSDALLLARKLKADYALEVKVLEFETKTHQGYNREKKYDSLLAKEQGEKAGTTEVLVKVKSLEARYKTELLWTNAVTGEIIRSEAFGEDRAIADESKGAIYLPPRLRFMENLANKTFHEYFK